MPPIILLVNWKQTDVAFRDCTRELAAGLTSLGCTVDVLYPRCEERFPSNVVRHQISEGRRARYLVRPVIRHLQNHNPDVLIAIGSGAAVPSYLASRLADWQGIFAIWEHAFDDSKTSIWQGRLRSKLLSWARSAADARAAVSEPLSRTLQDNGSNTVSTIPNPFDSASLRRRVAEAATAAPQLIDPRDLVPPVIGVVGRLAWDRDPEFALDTLEAAIQIYGAGTLIFVGAGELEQSVRDSAIRRGVADRVRFLGWVPEPFHAFQLMDVLLCTPPRESFGRATVEALAAGVPVLAARGQGGPEFLAQRLPGITVAHSRTAVAVATQLRRALETPRPARREFYDALDRAFSAQVVARSWLDLLGVPGQ